MTFDLQRFAAAIKVIFKDKKTGTWRAIDINSTKYGTDQTEIVNAYLNKTNDILPKAVINSTGVFFLGYAAS